MQGKSRWIMTPSWAYCCMTAVLDLEFALWSEKNILDPLFCCVMTGLTWFMLSKEVLSGGLLCYLCWLAKPGLSRQFIFIFEEQGCFPFNWQVLHNGHLVPASLSLPLFKNTSYRFLNLGKDFRFLQVGISGRSPLLGTARRKMKASAVPPWGQSSALHSCLILFKRIGSTEPETPASWTEFPFRDSLGPGCSSLYLYSPFKQFQRIMPGKLQKSGFLKFPCSKSRLSDH